MIQKFLICLFLCAYCSAHGQVPIPEKPNPPRLVNDLVGILKANEKENLEQQLVQYDNTTSIQICVVVVSDAVADGSDEAIQIGHEWGVGQKGLDNGVVFFIAFRSHKLFIASGKGIEGDLPDIVCSRICRDDVAPYFKSGDYAKGVQAGIDAIKKSLTSISWNERENLKKEKARREQLKRDELIANLSSIGIILSVLGLLFLLIFLTVRKSKRVARKVKELRKFYSAILADEVELDENWPNWAKEAFEESFDIYVEAKSESTKGVNSLPSFFITRLFYRENKFVAIKDVLEKWDVIDRNLTKVRDDVVLYSTRAEQAIIDVNKLLQEVTLMVNSGPEKYDFKKDLSDLAKIESAIKKIVITSEDSKRDCFLMTYQLSEELSVIREKVTREIEAEKKFSEEIQIFLDKQKDFESMVNVYTKLLSKLSKYPSTAANGIRNISVFIGYIRQAKKLIANVLRKVDTKANGVYTDALLRIVEIQEIISKIESATSEVQKRLDDLDEKEKEYPEKIAEVQQKVLDAEEEVKDSDVGTKAQTSAREARIKLDTAERLAGGVKVDWILIDATINEAYELAKDAISKAKSDKSTADYNRSSSNNTTFTTIDINVGGGSIGGGGFGGFGGGDFGGGGGGGTW